MCSVMFEKFCSMHWGRGRHICVSELGHNSPRWLVWSASSQYLNQVWLIVDWGYFKITECDTTHTCLAEFNVDCACNNTCSFILYKCNFLTFCLKNTSTDWGIVMPYGVLTWELHGSTFHVIIACCLTAPNHCPAQWWFLAKFDHQGHPSVKFVIFYPKIYFKMLLQNTRQFVRTSMRLSLHHFGAEMFYNTLSIVYSTTRPRNVGKPFNKTILISFIDAHMCHHCRTKVEYLHGSEY